MSRSANSLVGDSGVEEKLRAIAACLESNPSRRDDLLQVARVRLWRDEQRHPGQTRSWYIARCRRYMQHFMERGRSIDSHKRSQLQVQLVPDSEPELEFVIPDTPGRNVYCQIYADDEIEVLSRALSPPDNSVLALLNEGLTPSAIRQTLKLSGHTLSQRFDRIRSAATRLGFKDFNYFRSRVSG